MDDVTRLDAEWYDYLETVAGAFYEAMSAVRVRARETAPLSPLFAVRSGYAESPGWFMIQAAEFDPEPLTVENLRVRDVYASERIVGVLLELMASEKWFDRTSRDEYVLADAGRAMLEQMFARRRNWLTQLAVEADAAVALVERMFCELIETSLQTLPQTWCLAHSRRRAHWQEISALGKIFQALEDFNALRDDAHMAAWMPLGVSGHVWEAFGFLDTGRARDADTLFDVLHYRGYTRDEYANALSELAARGWLDGNASLGWRVTELGRVVRTRVEALTDRNFFSAWKNLSVTELQDLWRSLEHLRRGLAPAS